jgi:hypothetical protein
MLKKQHLITAVGGIIAIALLIWIVDTSPSFHQCVHEHKNDERYNALHQSGSVLSRAIINLRLNTACVGDFTRENEGAITALATLGIALFTVILANATIGLRESTKKLWEAGERQIAVAEKSAEAAKKSADASLVGLRPWVSCHVEIAGPLKYTSEGDAFFEFRFTIKNVGHTPAMGIRFSPHITLLSPKHEPSILRLNRMANHHRAMPVGVAGVLIPGGMPLGDAELGLVLFPDETYTFNYKIPVKRSEIEKACEDMPTKHFFPEVFGLVTYTYPLAKVRADTGLVCHIEKPGSAFELGEPVPLENMRLSDHALWSGFAT